MNELVFLKNDEAVTDSLKIASYFHKNHKYVLEKIEKLLKEDSAGKLAQSISKSTYKDSSGKTNPKYEMNRDGFVFLVMGFTGEKANQWKWNYISAFNSMESYIRNHAIEIAQRRTMTDAIQDSGENERMHGFGYGKYTDLIYKVATGKTASQHRKELGLAAKENVKPYMTPEQVAVIGNLETIVSGMIQVGLMYKEIKNALEIMGIKQIETA